MLFIYMVELFGFTSEYFQYVCVIQMKCNLNAQRNVLAQSTQNMQRCYRDSATLCLHTISVKALFW